MFRRLPVMLAAPWLVVAVAARDSSPPPNGPTPNPPAAAPPPCPSASPGSGTSLTITAMDFCFSPSSLSLKAGTAVNITFVNAGTKQHDLTLGGQDLGSAQPGE